MRMARTISPRVAPGRGGFDAFLEKCAAPLGSTMLASFCKYDFALRRRPGRCGGRRFAARAACERPPRPAGGVQRLFLGVGVLVDADMESRRRADGLDIFRAAVAATAVLWKAGVQSGSHAAQLLDLLEQGPGARGQVGRQ